jgi:hypothetical protein
MGRAFGVLLVGLPQFHPQEVRLDPDPVPVTGQKRQRDGRQAQPVGQNDADPDVEIELPR